MAKGRKVLGFLLSALGPLTALGAGAYLLGKEASFVVLGWVLVISAGIAVAGWLMNLIDSLTS